MKALDARCINDAFTRAIMAEAEDILRIGLYSEMEAARAEHAAAMNSLRAFVKANGERIDARMTPERRAELEQGW